MLVSSDAEIVFLEEDRIKYNFYEELDKIAAILWYSVCLCLASLVFCDLFGYGLDGGENFLIGILLVVQSIQKHVRMSLQHGQGRPQVMGKSGVQPFAFFYRIPHSFVSLNQLLPHGLKGLAESPQFILPCIVNVEIQIIV